MRVLDTATGHFINIDPKDQTIKYAILSHTWRPKGEQTYQQLRAIQKQYVPSGDGDPCDDYSSSDSDDNSPPDAIPKNSLKPIWPHTRLSSKIREACRVARENGYRYLWIDSCCIDKTSSSELSESINSMYQWYALADICYAFLADVPAGDDHRARGSHFRRSRWFTRGWTLQELVAPLGVVFFAKDWTGIGSKVILGDLIAEITKIDYNALLRVEPLETFSVAQRFSWASGRETTRVEDQAYSLLGMFDINMPTLYGEGERAFRRLQEEIMRRTPDQSLFAWTWGDSLPVPQTSLPASDGRLLDYPKTLGAQLVFCADMVSLLAPSSIAFRGCKNIKALSHDEVLHRLHLTTGDLPARHYDFTPYGIRVQLPVMQFSSSEYFPLESVDTTHWQMEGVPFSQWYLVILGCEHRDLPGCLLGRICYIESSLSSVHFLRSGYIWNQREGYYSNLLPVSPKTIVDLYSSHISPKMLYIPQPLRSIEGANVRACDKRHKTINLILGKKNQDALLAQGYTATVCGPDNDNPTSHLVTLAHDAHTITIDYQHTLATSANPGNCQTLTIEAHVKTSKLEEVHCRGSPGTAISWVDIFQPWQGSLEIQHVELEAPNASTLSLGLDFVTTNHYLLSIELKTATPSSSSSSLDPVVRVERKESDAGCPGPSGEYPMEPHLPVPWLLLPLESGSRGCDSASLDVGYGEEQMTQAWREGLRGSSKVTAPQLKFCRKGR